MKKNKSKFIISNFIKKTGNYGFFSEKEITIKKWKNKIITVHSKVNSDTFNIVCSGNFNKIKAFKTGEKIINKFAQQKQKFSWWISEKHLNKQANEFFTHFNLSNIEKETVMFANVNAINIKTSQKENFQIEKVVTDQQYLLFIELIINAFNPEDIKIVEFYQKLKWHQNPKFHLFLGYFENKVICCGSIYFSKKIAGIYDIVTSKNYQNQGFATLLLNKLLSVIKEKKWNYIALQSTINAIEFYRRIGFSSLFELFNYSPTE